MRSSGLAVCALLETARAGGIIFGNAGWYRTLDQLLLNKDKIEVALYQRLRDLFDFQPDLVFYDLTSTYFAGPVRPVSPSTVTAGTASPATSKSWWAW